MAASKKPLVAKRARVPQAAAVLRPAVQTSVHTSVRRPAAARAPMVAAAARKGMAQPKPATLTTPQVPALAAPALPVAPAAAPPPDTAHLVTVTDAVVDSMVPELKSSVALVVDQHTNEVLLRKNDAAVLPIASLTKLMTALVLLDAHLPMQERITITEEDNDTVKGTSSRLVVGAELTRGELLHLALMSSENRAAHALARTTPGGVPAFVVKMNEKAQRLGMRDTSFVEPTGLSSRNQSSAHDLVKLVDNAHQQPLLRQLTTSPRHYVEVGNRVLEYHNTNRLVKNPSWNIGLQKTGYIAEAGQCLVMQVRVAGRALIMVFLDSAGKLSRIGDAARVRHWLENTGTASHPSAQAQARLG
ncbi:D-alanyl-D-alanine endopeptidase [Candidatus Symbiobacter mobilis]|uniref:D-alanyl-D-alanine endopeptidase n=1 Tax=Candidatus Symbiobacter mobilis TaxID=1436290 RepID=UPI003B75BF3F